MIINCAMIAAILFTSIQELFSMLILQFVAQENASNDWLKILIFILSVLIAFAGLVSFIIWDRRKKTLEIEKLRLEVENLRIENESRIYIPTTNEIKDILNEARLFRRNADNVKSFRNDNALKVGDNSLYPSEINNFLNKFERVLYIYIDEFKKHNSFPTIKQINLKLRNEHFHTEELFTDWERLRDSIMFLSPSTSLLFSIKTDLFINKIINLENLRN